MDPRLIRLYEQGERDDQVAAILRLDSHAAAPAGVRVVTRFGHIATVRLRRDDIPVVRAAAGVASMKPAMPLAREPSSRTNGLRVDSAASLPGDQRRSRSQAATGKGVVVALVDWGLDFAHPEFRYADGRTRLLALWDQSAQEGPASPAPYGYGAAYTAADINAALAARDPYGALGYCPADSDIDGEGTHGTHVMGIAAGNGRAGGPSGIAPDADLIFVHLTTLDGSDDDELADSATLLEAIDFVGRVAGQRPWVVNLSMGQCGEQHDGTTLVEQGLDAVLTAAPGRAIVQSAGNYWRSRLHSSGRLHPWQKRVLDWRVPDGGRQPHELEIWYPGRDALIIELRTPAGKLAGKAAPGERVKLDTGSRGSGELYHRIRDPNNLDNHVVLSLDPDVPAGDWKLALIGRDVVDGRFHLWIQRDPVCGECQAIFGPGDANAYFTTGSICNGRRTIAVGACDGHASDRPVAAFSSAGPTRDGRFKPDLLAPGVLILSARSAPGSESAGRPLLVRQTGTSMAAPHVAGTIALMFEAAPRLLRIEETHELLLSSVQKPARDRRNVRYGSGYLDVDNAVRTAAGLAGARSGSRPPLAAAPWKENVDAAKGLKTAGNANGSVQGPGVPDTSTGPLALCDHLIGMGGLYANSPGALLARVLSDFGPKMWIDPLVAYGLLDPAAVFDGFTTLRMAGLRSCLDPIFAVVAYPRQLLLNPLRPGDVLVRRALGEPRVGHAAFVAGPDAYTRDHARRRGLQLESNRAGWYVRVVEAGAVPHRFSPAFARLVANAEGQIPRDTLVLRPRLTTAGNSGTGSLVYRRRGL